MTTRTDQMLKAWVPSGYRHLQDVARRYDAVITYSDLAARVQEDSGVSTSMQARSWVGRLLELVAMQAIRTGDAPLAALAVQSDGHVGEAYRKTLIATGVVSGDLEQRAAEDRLECYRRYAADLPADGGRVNVRAVTRRVTAAGTPRPTKPKAPVRAAPTICPTCFMQIPPTGLCDTCD